VLLHRGARVFLSFLWGAWNPGEGGHIVITILLILLLPRRMASLFFFFFFHREEREGWGGPDFAVSRAVKSLSVFDCQRIQVGHGQE
jgi:hypothetical protein